MPPKEDDHEQEKSKDIFRKPRSDEDDDGGSQGRDGGSGSSGSSKDKSKDATAAQGGLEESKLKEGQSSTSAGMPTIEHSKSNF